MSLFRRGRFRLHSGQESYFKFDCDSLDSADWDTVAAMIVSRFRFRSIEGVPTGGLALAESLEGYIQNDPSLPTLIVDDVLTTGASMEEVRALRQDVIGVVLFARGTCPPWITPIFQLDEEFRDI